MKIRNDLLIPPAVEWWEKKLEEYLNTKEHLYDCIGFSEGQECCLEKKWIRNFIKKIIKKTKESRGINNCLPCVYYDNNTERGTEVNR